MSCLHILCSAVTSQHLPCQPRNLVASAEWQAQLLQPAGNAVQHTLKADASTAAAHGDPLLQVGPDRPPAGVTMRAYPSPRAWWMANIGQCYPASASAAVTAGGAPPAPRGGLVQSFASECNRERARYDAWVVGTLAVGPVQSLSPA